MAQAPTKHEDPHKDRDRDPHPEAHAKKVVGEEGALVMPLAEPGPGEPLVGARSVNDEWIPDGERDPHTIAEEQRIRSAADEAGLDPEAELEAARSGDAPPRRVAPPKSQAHDAEKRDAEIHKSAPAPHPTKK